MQGYNFGGERALKIQRNVRMIAARNKLAAFSEAIAEGASVKDAAAQAGCDPLQGNDLMQRLRRMMGPQAR